MSLGFFQTQSLPAQKTEQQNRTAGHRQPLVIAHRGLLKHAPENTFAAYNSCLNLRFGFELDVQRTRDGVLVCVHDSTLDRTTNAKGPVSGKTFREIRKLDAGSWFSPHFRNERIPTVEEVFKRLAQVKHPTVIVAVDVKLQDQHVARDLVTLAVKHKILHRLMFIGRTIESADMRRRLKAAHPETPVAHLANTPQELSAVLKDRSAEWAYLRFIPTRTQVEKLHKQGKRVFLVGSKFAGNEPNNWLAGAKSGADAILTDYPLELQQLLRRRK
ncbi:MAG: glycerophosphodiester phosphodiesterase [Planctomycetaceae bacterium]